MAGAARSIDASLMPEALIEQTYSEDIQQLNTAILMQIKELSLTDQTKALNMFGLSTETLTLLASLSAEMIDKVACNSLFMFAIEIVDVSKGYALTRQGGSQFEAIMSSYFLMTALNREIARTDIAAAKIISGLATDDLVLLANRTNAELIEKLKSSCFKIRFRGDESLLAQWISMPYSLNAKMIVLASMLMKK
jgi:hypothetical protein